MYGLLLMSVIAGADYNMGPMLVMTSKSYSGRTVAAEPRLSDTSKVKRAIPKAGTSDPSPGKPTVVYNGPVRQLVQKKKARITNQKQPVSTVTKAQPVRTVVRGKPVQRIGYSRPRLIFRSGCRGGL